MRRLKVLCLTPWYPTPEHRYYGVFVREYAKAVQAHCDVIVLHCGLPDRTAPRWWRLQPETDDELTDGIPTYRALFRPSALRGFSWPRRLWSVYRAVAALAKEHGPPDLIHAHVYTIGWAALLAGRLRRIPVVISEHSSAFMLRSLSRRQILKARWIFRLADAVLPVSNALRESIERYGLRGNFRVVPNVVNTELFTFSPPRGHSDGTIRLLTVASLVEVKGLPYLFRALPAVPWQGRQWQLDLVGDGPEHSALERLASELGIAENVHFHGRMVKKDVADLMRKADLFVLPSLVETFSVVTAEALASGLPVLVTRCGGPEEFVTGRSGMIVPPADAPALAAALGSMLDRLASYDRPAIAREAGERFGSATVGNVLYQLYLDVTKRVTMRRSPDTTRR